jgi:hypothetical protein
MDQNIITNTNPEKPTSAARLAANRVNAQKSTGPKTDAGRNASKLNALKHGIFSSEILVRGRFLEENHEEFAELHQSLCAAYEPVGAAEAMLVDQLVTNFWRTRRLQKAEAAEIALSVDRRVESLKPVDPQRLRQQWQNAEDTEEAMAQSVEGNLEIKAQLEAVRRCVEKHGELNNQAIAFVHFDGEPYELTAALEDLRVDLQKNPNRLNGYPLRAWQKEQVLAFVDRELADIGKRIKICREDDLAVHEAHKAAALVPAREVLDRIGVYETRLRRQFNTALTQLERLQRARRSREAEPDSPPERDLDSSSSENIQTKKRTQSPPVNPHPETTSSSATVAEGENTAEEDLSCEALAKQEGPAEKTNPNSQPFSRHSAAEAETVANETCSPESLQASSPSWPSRDTCLHPQNMQNEKTNPISCFSPVRALNP